MRKRKVVVVKAGLPVVIMVCPVCKIDATKALGDFLLGSLEDSDDIEVVCATCKGSLTYYWGRGGKGVGMEVKTVGAIKRMTDYMLLMDVGRGN